MKILGITGGVGAGKSTVLAWMEEKYRARVIQADQVAHLLQEPGNACYERIVEAFGTQILDKEKRICRSSLASLVFRDGALLERLNAIVHPLVKEYIIEEMEQERRRGQAPFVVVEAALLLEDRYDLICDEIWYVYADEETRIDRLMKSRGYSREKALGIMQNQMAEEEFRRRCKFVIDNSGNFVENTFEQIDKGLVEHGFLQHSQR